MSKMSRRGFVKGTAIGGAAFMISGTKSSGNIIGANDRVRIGVVGTNGRGQSHIDGWLGQPSVELAYLVDVDQDIFREVLRLGRILCDDHRDRLADMGDAVSRQRGLTDPHIVGTIQDRTDRLYADEIGRSEYGCARRHVDPTDTATRDGTAHEPYSECTTCDIADESTLSDQEGRIFEPTNRSSDPTHSLVILR